MPTMLYLKCVSLLNDNLSRKTSVWLTIYFSFILHKILKEEFWIEGNLTSGHLQNKLPCEDLVAAVNLLKPTGHVMHLQFKIQQLYVLPTLYLCVLYLSENKQRLVSIIS